VNSGVYKKGVVEFKGLVIEWNLIDDDTAFDNDLNEKLRVEEFRFKLFNKVSGVKESFKFFE